MSNDAQRMARAMQMIERLQERLQRYEKTASEPIAIVSLGCRFPGGANPEAFWQLLDRGGDAITKVPVDRWDADAFYDPQAGTPGKTVAREGGFIGSPQAFDAAFFGLSPKEAATLDPQQRLLLEVSWEAMERAGVVPADWSGKAIGVFVGISGHDYSQRLLSRPLEDIDAYLATGNSHSVAAGRLSYTFGFTGPAMAVDTACSSSLVALHLACRSLRNGECEAAIAGGVNRLLSPEFSINFSAAQMLAPDGRCKTFSAAADGFARAEGCGMLVLKRLSDAEKNGDQVLAVIKGSAVNQDGRSGGLTVPNGPSQQVVIRAALDNAGVNPSEVSYVEAHGTGTELGDPIEAGALAGVFGKEGRDKPLAIGSVKTNVGHMEAAAGIGGVIKVVLSMQHQRLPAHLHFDDPSPHIPWNKISLEVTDQAQDWPASQQRVAGVSSFGFSGTNAHIVLAAPNEPSAEEQASPNRQSLLMLSAKDKPALVALAESYAARLQSADDWTDVCWSAANKRSQFEYRLAIVADNAADGAAQLRQWVASECESASHLTTDLHKPRIAFLYTGQGSQFAQMGRGLYHSQPAYQKAFDRCAEILRKDHDIELNEIIFGDDSATDQLNQTGFAQPALFTVAYALGELWHSWGITPTAVLGHSIGEYAAAVVAGVMSLTDALRLVTVRGRLMQALPAGGGMMVVFADASKVDPLLSDELSIAALNGPANIVISGPLAALDAVQVELQKLDIEYQQLKVSHGFHSADMEPMLDDFASQVAGVSLNKPRIKFYSTLEAQRIDSGLTEPGYWCRQIREPVRFSAAVKALLDDEIDVLIEIGPQPILLPLVRICAPEQKCLSLPSLDRDTTSAKRFLDSLASLYSAGVNPLWGDAPGRRVSLPTYCFNRRHHWAAGEVYSSGQRQAVVTSLQSLLSELVRPAHSEQVIFPASKGLCREQLWQQHRVFDLAVLPAVGFVAMAFDAAAQLSNEKVNRTVYLTNITFIQALRLEEKTQDIQLLLKPSKADEPDEFEVVSCDTADTWRTHCVGRLNTSAEKPKPAAVSLSTLQGECTVPVDVDACYQRLAGQGVTYGDEWRLLDHIVRGENQVLVRLRPVPARGLALDPLLLDASIQSIAALFIDRPESVSYLPAALGQVNLYQPPAANSSLWSHAVVEEFDGQLKATIKLYDDQSCLLLELCELRLRPASLQQVSGEHLADDLFYRMDWQPTPLPVHHDLPAPNEIVNDLQDNFSEQLQSSEQQEYLRVIDDLESFAEAYAQRIQADLADHSDIDESHQSLWQRIGYLAERAGKRSSSIASIDALEQTRETLLRKHPQAQTEISLLSRCCEALPAVLTGECDPIEILFPNGDSSALTALYQDSPGAQLMNAQVAQAFKRIQTVQSSPLRVLEIGAGTGGTTASLLPLLDNADYLFTDISPVLVDKARERFTNQPHLSFCTFDITKDAKAQGLEGGFDLIIAANVLHATADLTDTLDRVRALLSPNGLVLLLETTRQLAWLDLIFGLTSGWWAFTDHDCRPDHALLTSERWLELLDQRGFEGSVLQTGGNVRSDDNDNAQAQSLIIAQRDTSTSINDDHWLVLGEDSDPLVSALTKELGAESEYASGCNRIVFISAPIEDQITLSKQCDSLLDVLKKAQQLMPLPTLDIVTRGALGGKGEMPLQSVIWGLGRTIELEHPELSSRRIDLDASQSIAQQLDCLLAELPHTQSGAVSYHHEERRLARLDHLQALPSLQRPQNGFELAIDERGSADGLVLRDNTTPSPEAGDVGIRVDAAGINFIDLLDSLGLLPFERNWLGVECSGEIVALGEDVKQFKLGDRVMALAGGSFRDQVNVDANLVCRIPQSLSMLEATTLPAAFLTAWHALYEVAQVQAGEHVLVHAGAGATGMAAIQVAQLLGAKVYATASRGKWAALRSLGIDHPMDSREAGFGNRVKDLTQGRGVDVILNSLTGDFISEGLLALAPQGRFIEIGKRDLWSQEQVSALRDDVRYYLVDLMALARDEAPRIHGLFEQLLPYFEKAALTPLPRQTFALEEAPSAFSQMQRSEHIGKLVLNFSTTGVPVSDAASYLITGGLGGLGIATAEWLVDQGARSIVLMGRTLPVTLPDSLQHLRDQGADIVLLAGDASDRRQLNDAIAQAKSLAPLRGVIHAAGVLHDGLLNELNAESMETVFKPKLQGALLLDELTRSSRLDFFVLYSSAASLLGSPGQGAHVAANSFLDTLAAQRRAIGLPALSINWGPWSEVGAAAGEVVSNALQSRGIESISPEQGLAALGRLLARPNLPQVGVVAIDWAQMRRNGLDTDPLFERLFDDNNQSVTADEKVEDWRTELLALPLRRRTKALATRLQDELAQVLGMSEGERPSVTTGFFDLGLDSLMSVELKRRLGRGLGIDLSPTVLFQQPNIQALAGYLVETYLSEEPQEVDAKEALSNESAPSELTSDDVIDSEKTNDSEIDDMDDAIASELAALDQLLKQN